MSCRRAAGLVAFCWALPCAAQSPASPCEGAVIDPARGLPAAAGEALQEVVEQTSQPGKPWSCRGGRVELESGADGAWILRVVPFPGAAPVVRVVPTTGEVVPLALAILALPVSRELEPPQDTNPDPPPAPSSPSPAPPVAEPTAAANTSAAPRWLELRALADLRFAFPSEVALLGPKLSFAFLLPPGEVRHWSLGAFARLGGPIASFRRGPGLGEADTGAEVGARFGVGEVDLRAAVTAGVAVIWRDLPRPAGSEIRVAPRFGLGAEVAWPTPSSVRLLVSTGADVTPPIFEEPSDGRAPLPIVSVGLAAGVEWAL